MLNKETERDNNELIEDLNEVVDGEMLMWRRFLMLFEKTQDMAQTISTDEIESEVKKELSSLIFLQRLCMIEKGRLRSQKPKKRLRLIA